MRTVTRRIDKLEHRLGIAYGARRMPLIIASPAVGGLNPEWYLQILKECGFFHRHTDMVNLCAIPQGLNQEERERFLRKRGAEICYPRNAPNFGVPIAGVQQDDDPAE